MSASTSSIHVELPDKIKVFEESDELLDFFKSPTPTERPGSSTQTAAAGTPLPLQEFEKRTIHRQGTPSTASSDLSATGIELGTLNVEETNIDINMEEHDPVVEGLHDLDHDPDPTNDDCRDSIRAILSINGDDGMRCGKYCSAAKFYNTISFFMNIIAILVEVLKNTRDTTLDGRRPWYPDPYPTPRLLRVASIVLGGVFFLEFLLRVIVAEAW